MSPAASRLCSSHHVRNTLQFEELQKLRAKTPVIKMSTEEFDRFSSAGTRAYSLLVFFNAANLKEAKNLKLKENLDRFKHLAKVTRGVAVKDSSHAANTVFFVEIDMAQSRDLFARFGVNNLPWITHIGKREGRQYAHPCLTLSCCCSTPDRHRTRPSTST